MNENAMVDDLVAQLDAGFPVTKLLDISMLT